MNKIEIEKLWLNVEKYFIFKKIIVIKSSFII